ncbi:response regulator [Cronbergia sp. UHCC 0137]|uniref:response regulator n=1 Tax=Cronbergia sp. UHCC 0137 TaxID=3110239 RepID=UPI002B1FE353|nr:response regulator [Cronbergia sp. UHCC 0137]MEA5617531.1 response regulator [Cronbergia sp. UHCC 0137]
MNQSVASLFNVGILKGSQILVVDNDVDSGVLYSIFFKHFGANVITSSSVHEALEILTWFIPNIIICEIRFLGESVSKLFQRLSVMDAGNRNHTSLVVTSTSDAGIMTEFPEIDIEKYLLKPVDIDQLTLVMIDLLLTSKKREIPSITFVRSVKLNPFAPVFKNYTQKSAELVELAIPLIA